MIDYNKIQPVLELYRAVQSEGSKAGIPHIILRTTGCTHRCWFREGGWCDSWYTSIHPEKGTFTLNQIKEFFEKNKDINHLMITGGSPTMHPELINEIVTIFKELHPHPIGFRTMDGKINNYSVGFITLETEGSHFFKTNYKIDLISLSPKFTNSIPKLDIQTPGGKKVDQKFIDQHNKFRLKKDIIKQLLEYHLDYHFKPVCNPLNQPEIWKEIEEFRIEMNIPKSKTWVMPPGDTKEEIIKALPDVINFCSENGYCFSGRDHIIAFDKQRCV